jgi:hypothetical protein
VKAETIDQLDVKRTLQSIEDIFRYCEMGGALALVVALKKWKVSVTYKVDAEGRGAHGHGCFRTSQKRRMENLPYGRCLDIARASREALNEAGECRFPPIPAQSLQ